MSRFYSGIVAVGSYSAAFYFLGDPPTWNGPAALGWFLAGVLATAGCVREAL